MSSCRQLFLFGIRARRSELFGMKFAISKVTNDPHCRGQRFCYLFCQRGNKLIDRSSLFPCWRNLARLGRWHDGRFISENKFFDSRQMIIRVTVFR